MILESAQQAPPRSSVEELFKRRNLGAEDVRLVVVNGVAHLDGHVASYHQKKALASAVAALPHVRGVANRLRVTPGCIRSDAQVRERVQEALQKDPILSLYPMGVAVNDGVVELRGKTSSLSERTAAEALAWSACGVRHVVNRLEVVPQQVLDSRVLAQAIKRGLQSCLGLAGSGIDVRIDQDAAYLTGSVASQDQRLLAEDFVRYQPLLRRVVNQLRVQRPARPEAVLRNLPPSA